MTAVGTEKTSLISKIAVVESKTDGQQVPISRTLFIGETELSSEHMVHVKLTKPIVIQPECKYEIHLEQNTTKEHYNQITLKKDLELKDGIKIRFLTEGAGWDDSKYGLITKLFFKRI